MTSTMPCDYLINLVLCLVSIFRPTTLSASRAAIVAEGNTRKLSRLQLTSLTWSECFCFLCTEISVSAEINRAYAELNNLFLCGTERVSFKCHGDVLQLIVSKLLFRQREAKPFIHETATREFAAALVEIHPPTNSKRVEG